VKIRRITSLLLALCSAPLALVGCGPEVPAGLGSSTSGPASQSKPPALDDAGAASSTGSGSTGSTGATTPTPDVDSAAVLAAIAQNNYQTSPAFTEVTQAPYGSAAVAGTMIREWVSTSSLTAYEAISPSVVGSGATVPVGTTIVRAVLAEDGGVGELTLMFKGPQGYNATLGDWWFGATDPSGTPLETDAGPQIGKLDGCFSCHIPRANDGYLFGVPLDDRSAGQAGASSDGGATESDAGTTLADASDDAGDDAADSGKDGGHHHGGHLVEADDAVGN
jgi:hypothetical protein